MGFSKKPKKQTPPYNLPFLSHSTLRLLLYLQVSVQEEATFTIPSNLIASLIYIYIYESWLNLILNLSILLSSLLGNNLVDAHELRYRFCQRKAQAVVRTVNEHMRKKLYSPTTPFFENEILYILLCILCANIQISIYN